MKPIPLLLLVMIVPAAAFAADTSKRIEKLSRADAALADYFRAETAALAGRCLTEVHTLADWTARRDEYRRQLQEMLGLWPWPERTDLKPVVTGKIERDDFTVEKVAFQASPGLYVTANLFLPKPLTNRAPAILYASGHKTMVTNGVSLGNKTGYQHHGEWFARNGYVCLVTDTLSLGEIQGVHPGTYREGMWRWNSRGYTPAGVEAWFNIRALDYLCTRPEVDKERIGMTGRSGGGSYTWTVTALDDRVKVAAPVAGMTDLQNQVVDGAVDGHCDCMFFVNTYRWDFPLLAALAAPRPLLIGNSDKDRLFPLDGVVRLYQQTRRIYRLYGETNNLGLLITEGPHEDTQEIQLPVFAWFNRFLKSQRSLIEMAAKPLLPPAQLKVFDTLPADAVNKTIQETFVPAAEPAGASPRSPKQTEELLVALKEKCFAGWPGTSTPASASRVRVAEKEGVHLQVFDFASQPFVPLRLYVLQSTKGRPQSVILSALDAAGWTNWLAAASTRFAAALVEENETAQATNTNAWNSLKRELASSKAALVFVASRGIGPTAWSGPQKRQTQIRRRFMLLGQTLDGMRVWDLRCAVQAVRSLPQFKTAPLTLRGRGEMGVNALYAALFEPSVARLELSALPKSHRQGPDYLNVLKVLDIPEALELAGGRTELRTDRP